MAILTTVPETICMNCKETIVQWKNRCGAAQTPSSFPELLFFLCAGNRVALVARKKIEFFHWLITNECATRINEWMSRMFGHPVTTETRASVSPTM